MPKYTTFLDGGSNSLSHIKSELLVSYSKFPLKNRFLDKAYSPRCNTQPFLPIRLHHHKRRLCMKDHRVPMLVAAATTCPTLFRGPPRQPVGGIAHTPCCLATYSLLHRHRPPPLLTILPHPRPILCTALQCRHRRHRHCAYRAIW